MTRAAVVTRVVKPLLYLAAVLPCAWIAFALASDRVDGDQVKFIQHTTGLDRAGLAVRRRSRSRRSGASPAGTRCIRLRRLIGLTAFWYALLHFLTYVVFDQSLSVADITEDVAKHPWVLVGFAVVPDARAARGHVDQRLDSAPGRASGGSGCTAWSTRRRSAACCTSSGWSRRTCGRRSISRWCWPSSWALGSGSPGAPGARPHGSPVSGRTATPPRCARPAKRWPSKPVSRRSWASCAVGGPGLASRPDALPDPPPRRARTRPDAGAHGHGNRRARRGAPRASCSSASSAAASSWPTASSASSITPKAPPFPSASSTSPSIATTSRPSGPGPWSARPGCPTSTGAPWSSWTTCSTPAAPCGPRSTSAPTSGGRGGSCSAC